jgi:hypothetical protein
MCSANVDTLETSSEGLRHASSIGAIALTVIRCFCSSIGVRQPS